MRELYEADLHKPGIYGSGRGRANAWDVFRRAPSRGGRGCRAAVDFVVCFGCGRNFLCYFFSIFFFERTLPAASMRPPCLIYLSTSTGVRTGCPYLSSLYVCLCVCQCACIKFVVFNEQGRGRFLHEGKKKLFIPGCGQGAIIYFSLVYV